MPRKRRKRREGTPRIGDCVPIGGKNKTVHLCFRGVGVRLKSGKRSPTGWVIEKK